MAIDETDQKIIDAAIASGAIVSSKAITMAPELFIQFCGGVAIATTNQLVTSLIDALPVIPENRTIALMMADLRDATA